MNLKYLLTILFSLGIFIQIFGQNYDPLTYAPSPSAAQLGSYGHTPVGLFTGTLQVNVPLYELKTKNLSLPISLSYKSNGLTVNKVSSNVGFDWSLLAGGVITRITRGHPDDKGSVNVRNGNEYPVDPDKPLSQLTVEERDDLQNYLYNWYYQDDTQPDLYAFNFAGYSGQFYVNDNHQVITVPYQKMDIELPSAQGFGITTADGVRYEFIASENTRIAGASGWEGSSSNSAFNLSKIIHPSGDEINFNYKASGSYTYKTSISDNRSVVVPHQNNDCSYDLGVSNIAIANKSTVLATILDYIEAPGYGKIVFETEDNRLDIAELRIKGLSVYDNSGNKIKSIELKHQFPHTTKFSNSVATATTNNPYEMGDNVHYRMFLDAVIFKDNQDQEVNRYSFTYYDLNGLPIRLSYAQDHWGFFNGASNSSLLPDQIPDYVNGISKSNTSADREPNATYAQKGMLKSVTYPTGGYTEFEYEGHKNAHNKNYGGVRLLKQSSYAAVGSTPSIRKYDYSLGYSVVNPDLVSYFVSYALTSHCEKTTELGGLHYLQENMYSIYWLKSSPIFSPEQMQNFGYRKVAVLYDENNQYGREEHEFEIYFGGYDPVQLYGEFPIYPTLYTNYEWNNGFEKSVKYFNHNSQLVKSIENNPKEDTRNGVYDSYVAIQRNSALEPLTNDFDIKDFFNIERYNIISKWQYIESRTIKEYDLNGENPITTVERFYYDNPEHAQLSKIVSTDSQGKEITTLNEYAKDFTDTPKFGSDILNEKFMHNQVLRKTIKVGDIDLSKTETTYSAPFDLGSTTDEIEGPIVPTEVSSFPNLNVSPPSQIENIQVEYTYDENANIIEMKRDFGNPVAFLWGYNNTLPVFKIENATSSAVLSKLTTQDISILEASPTLLQIKAIHDKLITIPNTMVTGYAFKPLYGMLASFDPNGLKTEYEYDDFGRLKYIKDYEGNIIQAYEYNYKSTQPQP
ncbi:hypothetical protein [Flexithrix dorotheae]|uniref:hypothetical protein n=1 Tax=Flexithrix dorotheae TaxID=70993 RepID=UPI00037856D5|nr:hypothetical protein [Flexithrix dorotheae]